MSGTAVIVIVVLALVVVVGGSILILSLNRREHQTPSNAHQGNNCGEPPTPSDQAAQGIDSKRFEVDRQCNTDGFRG